MTPLSPALVGGATDVVEAPMVPRPRAKQDSDHTGAADVIAAPLAAVPPLAAAPTLTVAPELASTERPRRGADRARPWIGLAVATLTVTAGGAAGLGLGPVPAAALVALWPLCLVSTGYHRRRPLVETAGQEARRVLAAAGRLGLLCWSLPLLAVAVAPGTATPWVTGSPALLALAVLVVTVLTLVVSATVRRTFCTPTTGLVLVGHPDDVAEALPELGSGGYRPVAACLTQPPSLPTAALLGSLPQRVGLHQAGRTIRSFGAGGVVILPGEDLDPATVRRLQWQAASEHAAAYVATGLLDVHPTRTRAVQAGRMRVLHISHPRFQGPSRVVKEVAERSAALVAVALLAPVLLTLALAVRLGSTGPALFRQTRVGHQGKPFTMLKFRSMREDAEDTREALHGLDEGAGLLFKIRDDPRVTPLGRWMRKFSVDELPQLWNVVRGEMSLVGPRPALPGEVEKYAFDPRRRLAVKPGLTGLWQVSGRSDLDWEEAIRLDVRYVDNWSLRLDAWILARTVRAVLEHRGAY